MRYTMKQAGAEREGEHPLSRLWRMALLTVLLLPVLAAAQPSRVAPLRNPNLASLQIEIWPEYDRPAALVILRGAIAADAPLPADIRLRIPASSGGPSAAAYAATEGGNLLNLEHQRTDASDFITLRLKVPERFFHIEFYDPLPAGAAERSYSYVWPGDMAVGQMRVIVQEPAAASNFSVQPNLDAAAAGQDGLRYRSGELGAQAAGKQLPIKVRYTKTDTRTSAEIVRPKAADPAPARAAGSSEEVTKGVLIFIAVFSLLIGIGTAVLWWRGRAKTAASKTGGAGTCAKCGSPRAPGDRFCSKCGARLK